VSNFAHLSEPSGTAAGEPFEIQQTVGNIGRVAGLLLAATAVAFLTDALIHAPPNYDTFLPPAVGASYVDPVFGTTITRLTDALHTLDASNVGYLTWIEDEYSTANPFNSNMTRFLLLFQSYFGMYDGQGNYISPLPFAVSALTEPRWSRTNPNLLYFHNTNQLKQLDVSTMTITVVHTFSEYTAISGKGQMDISLDGDHFVLLGDGEYMFTYQISTDTKSPVFDTGLVSYSVLYMGANNMVTVSWAQAGTTRFTGVELFDVNMNFLRQLTHAAGHMHMGVDINGEPILIWNNSADPLPVCGQNAVVKVRLEDGLQTCLLSLDFSLAMHISAADNTWAFVETYVPSDVNPASPAWVPYTNEVLQIKLDGSQVRRLAHHRSRPFDTYVYEPKVSSSRDGSMIVYGSNFDLQLIQGNPTLYADTYMISTGVSVPQGIQNGVSNVTLPSISGTAEQGQTLTASTGVWAGPATAYVYQWQRCDASGASCVNLAGATNLQYLLESPDVATTLRVVVNASNPIDSAQMTSLATSPVVSSATYLVSDVFPYTGDSIGNFGDGLINTLDLITVLRAVTNIGAVPATCSDRFDAMDSFPLDTATTRGGDGVLNTLDLVETLKRATNIDTSRPTRASRGLVCPSASPQSLRPRSRATAAEGALEFDVLEPNDRPLRTAIYLRAYIAMNLVGLSFSVGCDHCQLNYVAGSGKAPSLVDRALPAQVAVAWLNGFSAEAGDRVLLGYLETNAPASLRFFGASANATSGGRAVRLALP
jgi:hypothetical protein